MPIVSIPNVGDVEFPNEMSESDIAASIKSNLPNWQTHGASGSWANTTGEQVLGRLAKGAAGGIAGPLEAIGIAASGLAQKYGDPILGDSGGELADRPTYQAGQYLRRKTAEAFPVDESRPHSFLTDTLPEAAGSMGSFIVGGLAGKVAKASGAATVAALGAGSTGADAFNEAKKKGASDDDAFKVFAINAGLGTTEAVPIGGWLARLNKASGNKLTRAIREGSEEALQEVFQQYGSNLTAQKYYDPERPWHTGIIEGGAAGMTLGSLMSLVVSGIGGRRARLAGEEQNAINQRQQQESNQPKRIGTGEPIQAIGQDRGIQPIESQIGAITGSRDIAQQGGQVAQETPVGSLMGFAANKQPVPPLPTGFAARQYFWTARGSSYAYDGSKSVRGRAGESLEASSVEPISDLTIFVSPDDSDTLNDSYHRGGKMVIGNSTVRVEGGSKPTKELPYSTTPQNGLYPIEAFAANKFVHFGSQVIEVEPVTLAPTIEENLALLNVTPASPDNVIASAITQLQKTVQNNLDAGVAVPETLAAQMGVVDKPNAPITPQNTIPRNEVNPNEQTKKEEVQVPVTGPLNAVPMTATASTTVDSQPLIDTALISGGGNDALRLVIPEIRIRYGPLSSGIPMQYEAGVVTINKPLLDMIAAEWPNQSPNYITQILGEELVHAVGDKVIQPDEFVSIGQEMSDADRRKLLSDRPDIEAVVNSQQQLYQLGAEHFRRIIQRELTGSTTEEALPRIDPTTTFGQRILSILQRIWDYLTSLVQRSKPTPVLDSALVNVRQALDDLNAGRPIKPLDLGATDNMGPLNAETIKQAIRTFTDKGDPNVLRTAQAGEVVAANETARRLISETQEAARGPEKTVAATTAQERQKRDIARETLNQPIIRDQLVGPIDTLNLSIHMLDGDLADFERIRRDPDADDAEVSAAVGNALDTIRSLDTATQVFNGEYTKERQLLLEEITKYATEEMGAMAQRDVDETLFKQFKELGQRILDQTADEAGLKALNEAQTHSSATLKVLRFLRGSQVLRGLQVDDNRSVEDLLRYIHSFITNNRTKYPHGDTFYSMITSNVGAGIEAIQDVLRIVRLSEPLRTEIAESQGIASGSQYAQPFHKIKARVLADIAKGNLDSAHDLYEKGLVEVGITLKEARDSANFHARKLRQALVSIKALDGAKDIINQLNADPEFVRQKRVVEQYMMVRGRTITSEGTTDWYEDIDPTKPLIPIVWERTLADREANVKRALGLIADYSVYIATPDSPGYSEPRAADMRRAIGYLKYYVDPSQDMALGRLVPSGLVTLADHVGSIFGHPQLIPQYSFTGATGPAYTNFNLTMVALSDVLERIVAIEKQYAGRRKSAIKKAVDSHSGMAVAIYHAEILDPLAASRQNFNDVHVLKVGDGIGNGHRITQEDIEYYKIVEKWQNEMLQVVNNYGQHKFESAMKIFSGVLFDGTKKVRFPYARGPNMLPRNFPAQLGNWVRAWEQAGTPDKKVDFLNQHLTRFVISYIDGVGQNDYDQPYTYRLPMKEVLRTKGDDRIKSFMDLVERITHLHNADQDNKPITVVEARDVMLGEIGAFLKRAADLLPKNTADQKAQLQVIGGDSEFNAERKQAVMPLGMYNFGVVTDAEVAGAMRGAAWPFVNAHLNAAKLFQNGLTSDVQQFEADAADFPNKDIRQQAKEDAAHGLRLYNWGQTTHLQEMLSNYLTQIQIAIDLSANPFMMDRPHQVLQNSVAKLIVTSLVAPLSPLTRNVMGGFAQIAMFNAEVRRLTFPLSSTAGQMVSGTFKEVLYLLTHEGNPATAKLRKFMESPEGRTLTLGMSRWFMDMANERRALHDYTARIVGINLNQKFWENTKGQWALRKTKGMATDVMPSTMRQWLNTASLSIDIFANFIGHATVGYMDARINSAGVYLSEKAEREFEEIAMRWGDKRMPNGLFPDKALARRVFGLDVGTATPATRIREWFRNAGIGPLDQLMTEYFYRVKAWENSGSVGLRPHLFSDPQFVQMVMGNAADENLATFRSRPPLFKQSKLHSTLGILLGYPFFLFKKLLSFTNVMSNQGFLRRHGENLPLGLTVALLIAITATLGNELASKWIKRELENKITGFPTISDASNPTQAAQAVLFATADAVPIIGSAFNMMMGTGYAKGYDLNSQFLMLNLASDVFKTSKEIMQTGNLGRPMLQFASRYTFPLNIVGTRLPPVSGLREFSNARNILAMGARGTDLETKIRKSGIGVGSANYSASTPLISDAINALGKNDMEGFERAYNALVAQKRRSGSLNAESSALSALRGRSVVTSVFGTKLTADELERVYRNVSPDLAKRARTVIDRFDQAVAGLPRKASGGTKTRSLSRRTTLRRGKLRTPRLRKLQKVKLRRQLV